MQSQSTVPFATLPPEMVTAILYSVTDLDTLANVAVSSRTLHTAFKVNETRLIRRLLIDNIGQEVLPDALIAYSCTPPSLRPRDVQEIDPPRLSTMADWWVRCAEERVRTISRPELGSIEFNMARALELERTHVHVAALAERFIQRCSETTQVGLGDTFTLLPPSSTEKTRIARALYLFETFCTLFGYMNPRKLSESVHFLRKYEPWEIAQLGVIHDFLAREIIPVFTDVAKEAAARGDDTFGRDCDIACDWIQYTLSLGLEKIHTLLTAKTDAERRKVLFPRRESRATRSAFLEATLDELNHIDPDIGRPVRMVSYDDKDSGPKDIWEHSQKGRDSQSVYEIRDWQHRSWGYSMWDKARLEELGTLEVPWLEAADLEDWQSIFPDDGESDDEESDDIDMLYEDY
ncbi:hypothetical protein SLS62_006190 [Diatrype stigma]|uniref:F-box domain-containing protein n=1 Tax=Diatrype stigma TaxID=117547 RepID=A0AAN9UZ32_9PEZI